MPICDDVVVAVLQKSQSSEWRHVVVAVQLSRVSSRGRVKVYVDGRRVGRGRLQGKLSPIGSPMIIGANDCGSCTVRDNSGLMDSISFARISLAARQIQRLYDSRGLCTGLPGETESQVNKQKRCIPFIIKTQWNSLPLDHPVITIKLCQTPGGVRVSITAPFFNSPPSPSGTPGEPFMKLWDYEVVEVFFLNSADHYLEVEFCPHGQHLVLFLNETRSAIKLELPLEFTSTIDGDQWQGEAIIPASYFPPKVNKFNAYAIHGEGDGRVYEALYPVPTGAYPNPDLCIPFIIKTQWNSLPLDHPVITIKLCQTPGGVRVSITAPFFNSPPSPSGTPGEPFMKLWDYEVVEVFFLNSADHYLEVEFCPHGQHLVLFLNETRSAIKLELPLEFTSTIDGDQWQGEAIIPASYFPPKVNKFNAYAIHGEGDGRVYEALYPVPTGAYPNPDLCIPFIIKTQWNSLPLDHPVITIKLCQTPGGVRVSITAPFFNSPPSPSGKPGEPFMKLWDYEVVEVFFLNSADHYLEVEFCPHGQHLVLFLNETRSAIKFELPLEFTSTIDGDQWQGEAIIPASYFPPKVNKFNAYAIHGEGDGRVYEALYPVPTGAYPNPDLCIPFIIKTQWNSLPLDHPVITIKLCQTPGGVRVSITAPFFNSPPSPSGTPGEPFMKLWDYEVVEVFFLNSADHYLEVEFCPHGQHLVLFLNETRSAIKLELPLEFTSTIDGDQWQGEAIIPASYFPPKVNKFNAYAIHGEGDGRVYEALYPVPTGAYPNPDFHRLDSFQTIDFKHLLPENQEMVALSDVWTSSELYSHNTNGDPVVLNCPQTTEEDDYPILREEVEAAVKSLKKGKSAGIDNIPAKLVQAGGEALITTLTTICNKIWQTGEWPTPWTQSLIITLPKKGNLQMCQNYRTISLISHPSKVMLKILLNRLKPQAEEIIAEEQAGFRAGLSTIEQIFNLRILCEKHLQHQQSLYHVFIDFKKAFDKVWHAALWATMRKYNIGSKLVRTIEHLYDNATSAVTFNSSIGDWFRTTVGVRQGCLLSPTLFNIFLERIMTDALENHQGTVSSGGRTITNLRFADDIDGLAGDEQELVNLVEHLEKTSSSYGMEISAEKTKLMTNSTQGISTEVKVNGQRLEAVTSFRYLGSIITDEGSKPEILARIAQTTAALTRLKPLWNDRNITVSLKIRLMRSLVMSIFLYACETWTLSADL
ncbi:hypothetical protein LSAT2_027035 [Lamellibrachia satsuma]|nr:hypothetical protein LSAT2_027035 [Lamellibrachia satsuma]